MSKRARLAASLACLDKVILEQHVCRKEHSPPLVEAVSSPRRRFRRASESRSGEMLVSSSPEPEFVQNSRRRVETSDSE